jgi:hypothetical protein
MTDVCKAENTIGAASLAQPLHQKGDCRLFDARNLRFLPAKQAKIAVFSRKAKTTGVSHLCIDAFDSPPFFMTVCFGFSLRLRPR